MTYRIKIVISNDTDRQARTEFVCSVKPGRVDTTPVCRKAKQWKTLPAAKRAAKAVRERYSAQDGKSQNTRERAVMTAFEAILAPSAVRTFTRIITVESI